MFKIKSLLLSAALLSAGLTAGAATTVTNLRTESMETPVGIDDSRPYFSWQMSSDRIGASQRAYRLMVAADEEALASGNLVYDSGMVYSDVSLNVPYEGAALRGSTRYFWKVRLLDESGATIESEPTWFETGLMGIGWGKAQWIGSQEIGVSKYRTFFNIDYNVRIPEGSRRAVFAYSVKDEDNYITAELDLGSPGSRASFRIDYCVEGQLRHLTAIDLGIS